jgi:hypothetical protein
MINAVPQPQPPDGDALAGVATATNPNHTACFSPPASLAPAGTIVVHPLRR